MTSTYRLLKTGPVKHSNIFYYIKFWLELSSVADIANLYGCLNCIHEGQGSNTAQNINWKVWKTAWIDMCCYRWTKVAIGITKQN